MFYMGYPRTGLIPRGWKAPTEKEAAMPNQLSELDEWKQAASVEAGLRREFHGKLAEARKWLDACLGLVDGRGPPNWDGIRDFLKRTE